MIFLRLVDMTSIPSNALQRQPSALPTRHPLQRSAQRSRVVFFYGTLLVPAILVRVLGHDCADLTFQDAALHVSDLLSPGRLAICPSRRIFRAAADVQDFTRHQVKDADYPAVINRDQTATLVPKEKWV